MVCLIPLGHLASTVVMTVVSKSICEGYKN
jgi:hypothetical protein